MSDFFDDQLLKSIETQREKIKQNIEEFQKARAKISEEEVDDLIPEIRKHYKEQLKKSVEEREVFIKDSAAYVVFQTDDEKLLNDDGTAKNLPKQTKNGSWYLWARFPLMTGDDAGFPERITVFANDEEFTFRSWKTLVLAKGRLKTEYKLITDEGYHKSLAKFLKENEVESLDELDASDYVKKYTFNLDQVLQTVKLK